MQPPKLPAMQRNSSATAVSDSQAIRAATAPPPLPPRTANRSSVVPWIGLAGAGIIFTCVGGAIAWRLMPQRPSPQDVAVVADSWEPGKSSPPAEVSRTEADPSPLENVVATEDGVEIPTEVAMEADLEESSPNVASAESEPEQANDPTVPAFADLERRGWNLELPQLTEFQEFPEVKLARLPVSKGEAVQLALLSSENSDWRLSPAARDAAMGTSWTVSKRVQAILDGGEDVAVAKFRWHADDLHFQWLPAPDGVKPQSLQFCPLEVRIGAESRVCQLWQTKVVSPFPYQAKTKLPDQFAWSGTGIDRPDQFRVCYQLASSGQITQSSAPVPLGEHGVLPLEIAEGQTIDLELTLALGAADRELVMNLMGDVPPMPSKRKVKPNAKAVPEAATRSSIIPSMLNGQRSEIKRARITASKTIDENQKKITDWEEMLLQQQQNNKDTINNNFGNSGVDTPQPPFNPNLAAWKQQLAQGKDDLQLIEQHEEWRQNAAARIGSLEREAIHFAIYVEGSRRVVVIQSDGFDWSRVQP